MEVTSLLTQFGIPGGLVTKVVGRIPLISKKCTTHLIKLKVVLLETSKAQQELLKVQPLWVLQIL